MNAVIIQRTLHAQEHSLEESPVPPTNPPHYHRPFSYNSIHEHIKLSFKTGELINLPCEAVKGPYVFENLESSSCLDANQHSPSNTYEEQMPLYFLGTKKHFHFTT